MARRAGSLTLDNGTGTRTVTVTLDADNFFAPGTDPSAGDGYTIRAEHSVTGVPPQAPSSITITMKDPFESTIRTFFVPVASGGTILDDDMSFTHTGTGTLDPADYRAGTIEVDIRMTSTGGVAPYDVSSDNRGTQSGGGTVTRNRAWDRATCGVDLLFGGGSALTDLDPFVFLDSVWVRVTPQYPLYGGTGTVSFRRADTNASLGSSSGILWTRNQQVKDASVVTVLSGFPAAQVPTTGTISFSNATVSAAPAFVPVETTVSRSRDVDARVYLTRHIQADDNVFAVSKNIPSGQRLTSQLCFLNSRFTTARGEGITGASVTRHLYDAGQLVATPTAGVQQSSSTTTTTTTADGEAGWLPVGSGQMIAWDEALPGGTWYVRHTSSSFGGLITYDGTSSSAADVPYTLTASDPNLRMICAAGPSSTTDDGTHFVPGDPLLVGLCVFNTSTNKVEMLDDGPTVALGRFNTEDGVAEYLAADYTWQPTGDVEVYYHTLYRSDLLRASQGLTGGDPKVWVTELPGAVTAGWNEADIFIIGKASVGGVPVSSFMKELVTHGSNSHTGFQFDGPGFVGFPTR